MKGHKFKLEAVLKLRKIKEDICKMELGKLQLRLNELRAYKLNHLNDISEAYEAQEEELKNSMSVSAMKKYPIMIAQKREHIKRIDDDLKYVQEDVELKIKELASLKGDVKVIANMKEKSVASYKKQLNKKMNENLEEQNQNWNTIKDIL